MIEKEFEPLGPTLLVHVELPRAESREDLEELVRLAESAGAKIVESIVCKREVPDPKTFIGKGKVDEVLCSVNATNAQVVIFNSSLSPAQERNLEKVFNVRVMDRIALILDIFARRARTYEGKLQVELALLRYEQARLVRGWTHLERQKGGFGLRGGPGETQIELDRRALKERIAAIKEDLNIVAKRRTQNRQKRAKNAIPVVSFVGYTNAGKSTLFNLLTNSDVYAANQLFATLDPTLRTLEIKNVGKVVFADTVGFIRHLPHELVAAFKSTLEESALANLQIHVIDASDPRVEENIEAVDAVLKQIDAYDVPRLLVFNKTDLLENVSDSIVYDDEGKPVRVNISAKTGFGIPELLSAISYYLTSNLCEFQVKLSYADGKLRSLLYENLAVESEHYNDQGEQILEVKLRRDDAKRIDKLSAGKLAQTCQDTPVPWLDEGAEPPVADEFDFNFDMFDLDKSL